MQLSKRANRLAFLAEIPGWLKTGQHFSIPAECHSDDWQTTAAFDATRWFVQASPEDIVALARIGWGGDYEADYVAQHLATTEPDVANVLRHARNTTDCGFECHIDEDAALTWLQQRRPEVYRLLTESDSDPSQIKEADHVNEVQ